MKKEKKILFSAKNIAYFAVLIALVVVLQIWGGNIKIAGLSLNLALVPIALGAILFGPAFGAILGFICGFIIMINGVTGNEPFTFFLFSQSPIITVLLCIVKTTAAGALAGLAYRLIAKKNKTVAVIVASALVPIVNTGIFAIGCFVIYDNILAYLGQAGYDFAGYSAFYVVFAVVITWNFFIELLTSLVLSPVLVTVTKVVEKRVNVRKKVKNDNLS